MKKLQFVVPVLLGLEGLVADELRRLGMAEVAAENGRVFCSGSEADIPRLNINLRVGARVLVVLGRYINAFHSRLLPWIYGSWK